MPEIPEPEERTSASESPWAEVGRLRRMIEANPQVPWEADVEGRIVDFSQRWLALTGLTREQALGEGWTQVPHPDDLPAMAAAWSHALRTGTPYDVEHRIRLADGSYRWMRSRAFPHREGGQILNWYGSTEDVHDRKEAAERLIQIQQSLSLAMQGGRMGWWSRNLATGLITWSPELEAIFGLPPGGFGGTREHFHRLVHPDDAEDYRQAVDDAIVSGQEFVAEFRFRRIDGSEGWMEGRGRATYDEQGKATAVYGIGIDVTVERARQRALRESESQYRQIAEGIPQIVWTTRPDGYQDFFNTRWYEYTGMERGGERGWDWKDYLHPDDYANTLEKWKHSLRTGEPYDVEYRFRRASDGSYRWFLGQALPIRDESGEVVRWFGTLTDIHDAKETQRTLALVNDVAMRLAEDLDLQRIVQALTDASTEAVGAQFGAFFYNVVDETGEAYLLYTLSGAPYEAFASFGLPRATKVFAPTFNAEGVVRSDDITKDPRYGHWAPHYGMPKGHLPVVSYLAVPVVSRSGEAIGGLFFGHSEPGRFTADHERLVASFASQAAVAMDNARLYGRVNAMKGELEEQVRLRTVDLQAANDALTAFTYHVSHDLRGPLRAIVSTSRIVQEDYAENLPREAIDLLDRQAEAASKLGRLIDDLLRLSRLSNTELRKAPLDLTTLGREVAAEALELHRSTTARIEVDEGLTARADPHLLRLAILNLLENALKYSPRGGTVRLGRREDGSFFVSDQGIGIDPKYFGKIFEPFQRLHRDEEFAGTGIGLSNVRQVIERHGGTLGVESELGKGSTFWFTLP